jgi:cell division protein FtsI (penicillin-binding protein 3)
VFIYKIVLLQTAHDGYWRKLGDDLTLFQVKIEAERGNIFTEDSRILATTIPTFELRMDTKADGLTDTIWKKHIDSLSLLLSYYLPEKSNDEWKDYLIGARANKSRHLLLAKNVQFQDFKKIREIPLFKLGKNKSGFITIQSNTRKLPFGELAKRSIGYVSSNGKTMIGIEGMLNEELAGENREVLMQKVAGGVYMPVNDNSEFGSKPGLDVYTTIDVNLQDIAEASLYKSVTYYKADHGSVILMNVKTGEIKAIANIGKTKSGEYKEISNYAINELNEPGSVMKLASVMALLDEGYCDENTLIDLENGEHKYYDLTLKDDHPVSGQVTLAKALELSSNVGISKPVYKHFHKNKDDYFEKLEQFHLTKPYGLGIKGESAPDLRPVKEWSGVTLPWLSIGYEIRMTPLQVLGLYAAVANNGKLMQPYIIKEVRDNDKIIESFKPKVLNKQIAKPSTITAVRKMLEGVVDSGTASNIRNQYYKIAGKTGTNLIAEKKTGFKVKKYQASFVGYFPAQNPVYACIVVVNKPDVNIGYYGSGVAAPVFKDIADRLYSTDEKIHPALTRKKDELFLTTFRGLKTEVDRIADYFDWDILSNNVNTDFVTAISSKNKVVVKPNYYSAKSVMPNVVQLSVRDAIYLLESMGLRVKVEGKGKVKSQSVMPGERIWKGVEVKISLG